MINQECPIQEGEVKLSGVVSVPRTPLDSDILENWITDSFKETRFQNVLKRAAIRSQVGWIWHDNNRTQWSQRAIAVIACSRNDYGQILTKQYQLAIAVKELDPKSELLLLIAPDTTHVFGMVLGTESEFSTNILLTEKKEKNEKGWQRWRSKDAAIHNCPASSITISTPHQAADLALISNNSDRIGGFDYV